MAHRKRFQPDQGAMKYRSARQKVHGYFLIDPGVGTLRRAQVAGPSPGQVPQILWMITRRESNQ